MLRAGFVGFGRMGITHFSILNGLDGVDVKAVCEPSTTMRSVLGNYLEVSLYDDYKKMLEQEELDFIVISTPPDSHAEIIQLAIDKNINFFVEKPLTLEKEHGQKIVASLKNSSLVHQVGYVNRFLETFVELKTLIEKGIIGDVKTFSSEMYSATVLKDSSGGWRGRKKSGGGCMYEMASHCVDLAVYLFGEPLGVSGSVVQGIYSSRVDDLVSSTLHYERGVTGRILVNWSDASYRKPGNIVTVIGTKGKIVASKYHIRIYMIEDDDKNDLHAGWNTKYLTDVSENVDFYVRGNEFTRQLSDFLDCVRSSNPTQSTCFDAYVTDRVLESIAFDAESSEIIGLERDQTTVAEEEPGLFTRLWEVLVRPFK